MGKKSLQILAGAIAISFLLHMSLFGGLFVFVDPYAPKNNTRVEIDFIPQTIEKKVTTNSAQPKQLKQIVEQNKINNDIDPRAEYLSSHNQRVLKETVATNRGEFKNAGGKGQRGSVESKAKDTPPQKIDLFGKYKMKELAQKASLNPTGDQADSKEASQTRDYIKGRDPGLQTLLSTREFVYYTYYNRIRSQLSQHWESTIKEKMSNIYRQGRQIASDSDKITKVLITLNDQGTLIRVQVMGESGVKDLDDAAIEAFRAAAPFPNPPKGIVDADGTIKIRWDFVIEV